MSQPIVPIVVTLHAEEAALLWLRRELAVTAPHYQLADLVELEGRLAAHLDGLRIAGDAGWDICLEELKWQEPEELFPAAILAFESGQASRIETILTQVADRTERARAVVSALAWLRYEQAAVAIETLVQANSPAWRRMGIAAAAAHKHDPGAALVRAFEDADPSLRARALRAIGELGLRDLLPAAREGLSFNDALVQYECAWSLARLSDERAAIEVLKHWVEAQSGDQRSALQLVLGRTCREEATAWLHRLAEDSHTARAAAIGAGIAGRPEAVKWLLEMMDAPALARVAGEAVAMITGADPADKTLEGSAPDGFSAGPTEDPADADVAMDADENLPWPDQTKLAGWWKRRQSEFEAGKRYLCGRPMSEQTLQQVLRSGFQRQRAAAAIELSLAQPDRPLFPVRAMASRQLEWLG